MVTVCLCLSSVHLDLQSFSRANYFSMVSPLLLPLKTILLSRKQDVTTATPKRGGVGGYSEVKVKGMIERFLGAPNFPFWDNFLG